MRPNLTQYAYWERDGECAYWALYDTLEDAVGNAPDGTRIYVLKAKPIGIYKKSVVLVKVQQRKKKRRIKKA